MNEGLNQEDKDFFEFMSSDTDSINEVCYKYYRYAILMLNKH